MRKCDGHKLKKSSDIAVTSYGGNPRKIPWGFLSASVLFVDGRDDDRRGDGCEEKI